MKYNDDSRIATANDVKECAVYNHLMNECFEVCEKNGADIYAIGLELMQGALA